MFFGSEKYNAFLESILSGPYHLGRSIRTKCMLSFSGPLQFHRNFLNNALFWKWPLNYSARRKSSVYSTQFPSTVNCGQPWISSLSHLPAKCVFWLLSNITMGSYYAELSCYLRFPLGKIGWNWWLDPLSLCWDKPINCYAYCVKHFYLSRLCDLCQTKERQWLHTGSAFACMNLESPCNGPAGLAIGHLG